MNVSSEFCYLGAIRLPGKEYKIGRYQIEAYNWFDGELQLSMEVVNPVIEEDGKRYYFWPTFPGLPVIESLGVAVTVGTPGHIEFWEFIEPPFDIECGDIVCDLDREDIDWRIVAESIKLIYSKYKH